MTIDIRPAGPGDAERVADIYRHYIETSHITFDIEPWTSEDRERWFAGFSTEGPHRVFVAEADGVVVGVARSGKWRDKEAYAQSVETTVVLDPDWTGRGIGLRLLEALISALGKAGVHRAYAIIALPNEGSVALHHRLGYRTVGTQDESGFKFGRFWSTQIMELKLDSWPGRAQSP